MTLQESENGDPADLQQRTVSMELVMQRLEQKQKNGSGRLRNAVAPVVLFTLVVALYLPSVRFDFIYDDHKLVLEQPVPASLQDVVGVFAERHWYNLPYYRPVVRTTLVLQKLLHGDDAAPFHALNVALIALTAVAASSLLRRPVFGIRPLIANAAAALFALHPIASCTVYPVCSGRETLMPTLLVVCAMNAYLRPGRWWRAAAVILFALALFAKEQAVIVPLLFLLADLLGLTEPSSSRAARIGSYGSMAVLLAVYFLIRWFLFHGTHEHRLAILEAPAAPLYSVLYAVQTMWLPEAELVYEPPLDVWFSGWRLTCGAVGTLLLVACGLRSPAVPRKATIFWLGWILLSLLPTANVLRQEAPFAERYLFQALLGAIGILAAWVSVIVRRPATRQVVALAAVLVLLTCAAVSFHRGPYYQDDLSFHSQWVRVNPQSAQAHRSLGWVLLEQNRLTEAQRHLQWAIQLNPDNAEAYNNLGNVWARSDQLAAAIAAYERALQIAPDYPRAHYNLAMALARSGDLDGAASHFQLATQRPGYSEAHNGYGIVLQMQGQSAAAAAQFEESLRINPHNAEAHNNLGNLLAAEGRFAEAREHFERALEINPNYVNPRDSLNRMRAELNERE